MNEEHICRRVVLKVGHKHITKQISKLRNPRIHSADSEHMCKRGREREWE